MCLPKIGKLFLFCNFYIRTDLHTVCKKAHSGYVSGKKTLDLLFAKIQNRKVRLTTDLAVAG